MAKSTTHNFIFSPGIWIGEGKIALSTSPEIIHFYTKWIVDKPKKKEHSCQQQVEMQGVDESVFNNLTFSDITAESFTVILENEMIGKVKGKGIIDDKTIAWEYRSGDFEGFEVYELQDNGDYMLHAEYSSPDQYRTIIDGRIWKKISST
jgi:hypothetical protein